MAFKKFICFIISTFYATVLFAQNSTSSPYSGFGIGELEMSQGGRNIAMGQTGIALRSSLFLNTVNPASLTSIEPQSFFLDMGMKFKYTDLRNTTRNVNVSDGNLSWIQLGFPISKRFAGGLSLNPKSSVGYSIYSKKTMDGSSTFYPVTFEGSGGLNEAAGLLAYKLNKNISIGAKGGYLWGNVTQAINQEVSVNLMTYILTQEEKIRYSGAYIDMGIQISMPISSKTSLVFGSIAGLSSNLNSVISTTTTKGYNNTSDVLKNDSKSYNTMKLPLDLGAGISFLYDLKWVATFDYKHTNWKNATLGIDSRTFNNTNSFRTGMEFSPKNDQLTFREHIKYRLGYHFESGYLQLYHTNIHEQAFSFGIGLPIRKGRSYSNFSIELGQRGTLKKNLVQERFINLNCSFNLWENWFIKQHYN